MKQVIAAFNHREVLQPKPQSLGVDERKIEQVLSQSQGDLPGNSLPITCLQTGLITLRMQSCNRLFAKQN